MAGGSHPQMPRGNSVEWELAAARKLARSCPVKMLVNVIETRRTIHVDVNALFTYMMRSFVVNFNANVDYIFSSDMFSQSLES